MKLTQNVLEEASKKLAEVKKLLEQSKTHIENDSIKLSKLSKELNIARKDLRQQNIDFMSMLVDAGAELNNSNNFTVETDLEKQEKAYWVFKKGTKFLTHEPKPECKTDNFAIDIGSDSFFNWMRYRVTEEVCKLVKEKSKSLIRNTQALARDMKKSSKVLPPKR